MHIHQSLQNVIRNGDKFNEDGIDKRVAQLFMFDFEQSGIHLEETKVSTNKSSGSTKSDMTTGITCIVLAVTDVCVCV